MERVILATTDDEDEEDDLYKGYNEFHPALDTRNLQDDETFKETVNKSSYGRSSVSKHRTHTSTAGVAFNRATALKSRRTAASRGTAGGGTARPMTAVRGAGFTSQAGSRVFDPLGMASSVNGVASGFHLQNENTAELKIKQLETQINRLLEESASAADRGDFEQALNLAKDCVAKERSLNRMKEQSGLTETVGLNLDLTFATIFNLAEQYSNSKMWTEAINTYQSILKNRSFTNTGRLRMNIGEIHFRQGNYPKAIKFFRMALDQVANTQNELRLKLMQNIGLSFVRLTQFADAIASFEYIMSERGDLDVQTAFHLIVCYYALGDCEKMKYYFIKLLQVRVEDQFEERYGHHEILSNGGNLFVTPSSPNTESADRTTTPGGIERVSSPILLIRDEHDHHNNLLIEAIRNDQLRAYEKSHIHHVEWCILTSAKLISPFIEDGQLERNGNLLVVASATNHTTGYDWCLEQIRRTASMSQTLANTGLNYHNLADELELYKAVRHLRAREFDKAIGTLKTFERKDKLISARSRSSENGISASPASAATPTRISGSSSTSNRVAATAAANLSFLYLLQQESNIAARYADEAIAINRYSLGALLNKASYFYQQEDYSRACELYQETINTNPTCFEAHFNLALAERKMQNYGKALDGLFRLRTLAKIPPNKTQNQIFQKIHNSIEVNLLYQIGAIYETMGNYDQAVDFYKQILNLIPTDVSLLVKMSDLASEQNDRKQSLAYLMEAYRYLPSYIPTIERLAAYYIEIKMYEKAIEYLTQLANIQPNQIKWRLMIAASYRRAGNYQQAFTSYQEIHSRFPDNTDCLKFLIRLCSELENEGKNYYGKNGGENLIQLAEQYTETLKRLEKNKELREQQQLQQQQSSSRSASRASTGTGFQRSVMSREGSAATTSSGGSGSSGYMTSGKSKANSPMMERGNLDNSLKTSSAISAIVDQVVEQLDNTTLSERPTTSWRRQLKTPNNASIEPNGNADYDEDLLLDANIDDILPD